MTKETKVDYCEHLRWETRWTSPNGLWRIDVEVVEDFAEDNTSLGESSGGRGELYWLNSDYDESAVEPVDGTPEQWAEYDRLSRRWLKVCDLDDPQPSRPVGPSVWKKWKEFLAN